MRKILLALVIALFAITATAQTGTTINVTTAGTLSSLLTKTQADTVTILKLRGNIDARDIYFMRDNMLILAKLDLEEVNIVAFGIRAADMMPDYSFCDSLTLTSKTSLKSIKLPNNLHSIGNCAFYGCNGLSGSLIIPNSVVDIGTSAFSGCSGFTGSLTLPNSITVIKDAAFRECSGFNGNLILPNAVTSIGNYAFYYCSNLSGNLTLPNSVNRIGYFAFCGCSGFTGGLNIPNSITSINDATFGACSGLSGSLTIPNSVRYIRMGAFGGCSGFTGNLTIPNSVTGIGLGAFEDCSGLTGDLTIPNSVTEIGWFAFKNCSNFTGSLIIPNSVEALEYQAFLNCSGLSSIVIPSSVDSIADEVFKGCSNLQKITDVNTIPLTLGVNTFDGIDKSTCELIVPSGSKTSYQLADYWKDFTHISEAIFVFYDTQGGSALADTIVNYNTSITYPKVPAKIGYTFDGWYKEANCTNAWAFTTDVVTTNTTLYAKWAINNYTVTFDTRGGSAISNINANYNTTIATPTVPTRTGYTFEGWYKESACTNAWNFTIDVVIADTTLFAKWVDIVSSINNSSIQEFGLYPNPADDVVILEGNNIQQATIINLIGVVVMQVSFQVNETKTINVSELKSGSYLIHIKTIDNNTKILKLIKNNYEYQ